MWPHYLSTEKALRRWAPDGSMTLGGHLKELRNRVVFCAVLYAVAFLGFLAVADQLINVLTAMASGSFEFISIDPQEKLIQYFRVALIAALIVDIPFIAYHIYAFAKPGLKKTESFFFGLVLVMGLGLFVVGVLFAYFVSLPFMLNFMASLEGADYIVQTTSIASYVSFCITIFLIFGAVFEMPLVVVVLSRMGIVSPSLMKSARGVMVVLIFFVAAVITPPDVVSQTMVALPMCLLYIISTFLCKIFYKKHQDAMEDDEDEDEEDEEEA